MSPEFDALFFYTFFGGFAFGYLLAEKIVTDRAIRAYGDLSTNVGQMTRYFEDVKHDYNERKDDYKKASEAACKAKEEFEKCARDIVEREIDRHSAEASGGVH